MFYFLKPSKRKMTDIQDLDERIHGLSAHIDIKDNRLNLIVQKINGVKTKGL